MHTHGRSPIVVLKQHELELARRREAARQEAERHLAAAAGWAIQERERAEREGRAQAALLLRAELERVEAEVDRVRAEGERQAAALRERGAAALPLATRQVLALVLPAGKG